jgi:hypothetical protein
MSSPWGRLLGGTLVLAALCWVVLQIREDGAQAVRNSIERQNNEAANSADAKRLDYDACSASGGLWNFGAGKCQRPARSGRH